MFFRKQKRKENDPCGYSYLQQDWKLCLCVLYLLSLIKLFLWPTHLSLTIFCFFQHSKKKKAECESLECWGQSSQTWRSDRTEKWSRSGGQWSEEVLGRAICLVLVNLAFHSVETRNMFSLARTGFSRAFDQVNRLPCNENPLNPDL